MSQIVTLGVRGGALEEATVNDVFPADTHLKSRDLRTSSFISTGSRAHPRGASRPAME